MQASVQEHGRFLFVHDAQGRLLGRRPPVRGRAEDKDLAPRRRPGVLVVAEYTHNFILAAGRAVSESIRYVHIARRLGLSHRSSLRVHLPWLFRVGEAQGRTCRRVADIVAFLVLGTLAVGQQEAVESFGFKDRVEQMAARELVGGRTVAGLPRVEVGVSGLAPRAGEEELGLDVGSLEMDLDERRR
jgi:hypothetical protein